MVCFSTFEKFPIPCNRLVAKTRIEADLVCILLIYSCGENENHNSTFEMPFGDRGKFGFLPSLELLPFFEKSFLEAAGIGFVARASYGSIARDMLIGKFVGGVLPWEIFVAEVLALPGQRNQWKAMYFSTPSPAELVLQTPIFKALTADSRGAARKVPARLSIGIESRSSFTRHQFSAWLNRLKLSPRPEVSFKFLPMDQRLLGMPADALDGFIARSPWGLIAEEQNLGRVVENFSAKIEPQPLVTVCRKERCGCDSSDVNEGVAALRHARSAVFQGDSFDTPAQEMWAAGKPQVPVKSLEESRSIYGELMLKPDEPASVDRILHGLQLLHKIEMLPPQIAPTEQTARLLSALDS